MSHYGDHYSAALEHQLLMKWTPKPLPDPTVDERAWRLAVAKERQAAHELAEIKDALRTLKRLLDR